MRNLLVLVLIATGTGCAGRKAAGEDEGHAAAPPSGPDAASASAEASPDDGLLTDGQMLAFFDALGDLLVRDLLLWAERDFVSHAEAQAELEAVMDKGGEYSRGRMVEAAKTVGIAPEAVADFLAERPADYVRLAEASTFDAKVGAVLDGPEVKAQIDRVEALRE